MLLSTSLKGRANVMTMSWLTIMEFEPPLIGCVINVPTVELSKQVVGCGNTTGRTTDKFAVFGLTARSSFFVLEVVKAWLDPALKDPRTLHHRGKGSFMVAGETIKLPSKMK